jgi:hypothetical protein
MSYHRLRPHGDGQPRTPCMGHFGRSPVGPATLRMHPCDRDRTGYSAVLERLTAAEKFGVVPCSASYLITPVSRHTAE